MEIQTVNDSFLSQQQKEGFTTESFLENVLPKVKEECISSMSEESIPFFNTLEDSDFIRIYAEWVNHSKTHSKGDQNGFIFEVLSQRYLRSIEVNTSENMAIEDLLLRLCDHKNMELLWGGYLSNPDGLRVADNGSSKVITKIYESKISSQNRDKRQRELSVQNVRDLVNIINNNNVVIRKGDTPKEILFNRKITKVERKGQALAQGAREHYLQKTDLPLELADDYQYIYVIPSDQRIKLHYITNSDQTVQYPLEDYGYINVPITVHDIHTVREIIMKHLIAHYS